MRWLPPGAAAYPVTPGGALVRQQGGGDAVIQLGLSADAALVGAGGLQPDGEGIGDVQPDHGKQLAVVNGDEVIDDVADESAPSLKASTVTDATEGESGPMLAGEPDDEHQNADDNDQRLAGEQAGQDEDTGNDYPQVA